MSSPARIGRRLRLAPSQTPPAVSDAVRKPITGDGLAPAERRRSGRRRTTQWLVFEDRSRVRSDVRAPILYDIGAVSVRFRFNEIDAIK
ncbi:hypothetical protein EVAR_19035_1 [Eumeta japonica]|uniref:Uncharacterized protein n=1 Tax=Eumeta variegata TaxID=151549 RepID=A0A4C1V9P8_EUMVA|nr:hypothetical protein EVAR_19035_1 [Eumeta japonica]